MTDHHPYLAILKASYDYEPQSDDELAIKENQILLLLDRVDDDWWKVKIKSDGAEDEGPSGIVPAAYVEPAEHSSVVKVLYEYEASAPGELSVHEGEVLLVYETDQDWLLVQSRKEGGKAGYVPGNYVEVTSEDDTSTVVAAEATSTRPASVYVDPADRVASSKASQPNSDSIRTWPVTDIDKKGKKKKGTLGVGNGAIFFASESDKTPVQKWQTSDVSDVIVEKGKQVRIDVGGSNPTTLHYGAGSKENAEAIQEKVQSSKSLASTRISHDLPMGGPYSPPPTGRKVGKKVSVHFSQSDPIIIPSREEHEEDEEEDPSEVQNEGAKESEDLREHALALYDFTADGEDELSIKEGEQLLILEKDGDEWWKCRNSRGGEGVVPASYLEVHAGSPRVNSPSLLIRTNGSSEADKAEAAAAAAREAEAERLEREEQTRAEKARKRQEAQRPKEAAAAEKRRKVEDPRTSSPAAAQGPKKSTENGSTTRQSTELKFPPTDQVRTWHDRTGQFRVDAAFLGLGNNKVRLHKVNGVIVEVPTEKMSVDDMRFVERLSRKSSKTPASNQKVSDDDVPLAFSRPQSSQLSSTPKKSNTDWFEFFLSAGCDLDDCTRYATSFEKDKIDEAILPDITESTMRTLGLREGDIIRVIKAIEKRKGRGKQPNTQPDEQIRRDEELARQLQAQETGGGSPRSPAPNLFAGPGGVLKVPRRRPQPTKSLPPAVDIKALSNTSEQAINAPQPNSSSSPALVQPPARTSSAAAPSSGFDDDAWTNRPSSAKPATSTPPVTATRTPSAPPGASVSTSSTTAQAVPTSPPPQSFNTNLPTNSQSSMAPPNAVTSTSSFAKTTEADIFEQLSRLSELRKPATPYNAVPSPSPLVTAAPPVSYQAGLGMGSSHLPLGQHLQNQSLQGQQPQSILVPSPSPQQQLQPQPYNGPRGPYAPVPSNQGLLQPLIPTQTGFGGFVPTRPLDNTNSTNTLAQLQLVPHPSLLSTQPTGFPTQMMPPQLTGLPFTSGTLAPSTLPSSGGFGSVSVPIVPQFTGFPPPAGHLSSNNFAAPPSVPPFLVSAASSTKDTSPANVFARMKSGTFANEDHLEPQAAEKYDALRPAQLLVQPTGWTQPFQSGLNGYPR